MSYQDAAETSEYMRAAVEAQREAAHWKETALTIQRNLAESHEREKRQEWLRGHDEGMEDAGKALDMMARENARLKSRLARVLQAAESWRWSVSVYQGSEQRGGEVWSGRAARGAKR